MASVSSSIQKDQNVVKSGEEMYSNQYLNNLGLKPISSENYFKIMTDSNTRRDFIENPRTYLLSAPTSDSENGFYAYLSNNSETWNDNSYQFKNQRESGKMSFKLHYNGGIIADGKEPEDACAQASSKIRDQVAIAVHPFFNAIEDTFSRVEYSV